MTRVTLAYARATRSPRVYRKAKAEFELTPSGQVMASLAERRINSKKCCLAERGRIGIYFGPGNPFNAYITQREVFPSKPEPADAFDVIGKVVSEVLHLAALRYICSTSYYLGVPKVAVATERFDIQPRFTKNHEPDELYDKTQKFHFMSPKHSKLLDEFGTTWNPHGTFNWNTRSKYPLYHFVDLVSMGVDLEIVTTGQLDRNAFTQIGRIGAKPLDIGKLPDRNRNFVLEQLDRLNAGELTVDQVRTEIEKNAPRDLERCLFAEHNRQELARSTA